MKKYSILLIGLLITTGIAAQPEAVFHKIHKQYTLDKDGSSTCRYQKELTINTHLALNSLYGETFVVYNPDFQSVKINESYTKQADGTIIKAPENAFNEALPSFAADAPAYNHLKELVITHTGLELGATLYLDYTITTTNRPGLQPSLNVADVLEELSPVSDYQIDITIPNNRKLQYVLNANETLPDITKEKNGADTYSWQFKQLPAASLEKNVPLSAVPCLYASTDETNTALKHIYSLLTFNKEDHNTKSRKLIEGKQTDKDKALAIQKYIVNEIANSSIPLNIAGKVRTPENVFATAYGTMAEKAGLFVCMLQSVGIESQIACIFPSQAEQVIGIANLTDMRIKVGETFFSVKQTDAPDITLRGSRDQVWIVNANKASRIPVTEKQVELNYQTQITLSDTMANIKGVINDSEDKNTTPEFAEEKRLQANLDYLTYTLPVPKKGVDAWSMNMLNSQRKQPFEIPSLIKEECSYEVTLGSGLMLKTKPFTKSLNNSVGSVSLTMQQTGQQVVIQRKIQFNKTIIPANEYNDFRELMLLWQNNVYRSFILKK